LDALLERQESLNFAPGTRFLYSNTGFRWLGQVVEQVAGETLASFLDRRIFQRLGMTSTRHTPDLLVPVEGLATGYMADGRRAAHAFPLGGEGGLVSSVEDLALWARSLSVGTLGDGLEAMLEAPAPFAGGAINRYALGLEEDMWRGLRTVSHGGLWPGYKTAFLRVPAKRITVIVIANNAALDPHQMALQVMEAALEGDGVLRLAPPPIDVAPMAGRWVAEGLSLDIGADGMARMHGVPFALAAGEDGRLHARRGAFPFAALPPQDGTMAVELDAGVSLPFRRAEGAPLPMLDGTWRCAELGAEWLIAGDRVQPRGPLRRGPAWHMEAIAPGQLRVHMPAAPFPAWADAVMDADGAAMTVHGGRARGLRFLRG
ncbi:MAG TPA: serine hydrolase, partial [Roseococcus sp.]|nr:serine hydrolase [Roseococcus sp.]